MYHDSQVLKIKCRTYEPAQYIGWIAQVDLKLKKNLTNEKFI